MTDLERFTETMAKMMGKCVHSFSIEVRTSEGNFDWFKCDKCGMSEGDLTGDYEDFNPITPEGELTPECRKWLGENLPETWEEYCDFIYCDIDFTNIRTFYSEVLAAQLSAENLWKWMKENTDSWLYEKCPKCHGTEFSNVEHVGRFICDLCNGTGRIARWDVKKWLEGKAKEVGA